MENRQLARASRWFWVYVVFIGHFVLYLIVPCLPGFAVEGYAKGPDVFVGAFCFCLVFLSCCSLVRFPCRCSLS